MYLEDTKGTHYLERVGGRGALTYTHNASESLESLTGPLHLPAKTHLPTPPAWWCGAVSTSLYLKAGIYT